MSLKVELEQERLRTRQRNGRSYQTNKLKFGWLVVVSVEAILQGQILHLGTLIEKTILPLLVLEEEEIHIF